MIDYGFGVSLDVIYKDNLRLLRGWRNDPRIWRWCRQNDLIYQENHEKWYEWQREDSKTKMYSILSGIGKLIGVCGLTDIDFISRRAEFSLYIAPEFQKRGFAKAGLKTLFSYGFKELGLNSIWGETFEDNHAQHLFSKIGMKKDGVRRQFYFKDGKFCDAILLSISYDEFKEASWISTSKVS